MKALLWVIIAAVLVGGGWYAFTHMSAEQSQQSSSPVSQTTSATPSANTQSQTPTLQTSAPVSTGQGPDCSQYISASQLIGALGLSSAATVSFSSQYDSCAATWKDLSSTFSTGVVAVVTGPGASLGISTLCKGKPSIGVGDLSCENSLSGGPISILIAKNNSMVDIQNMIGPVTVSQLTALGSLVASKL